MNLPGKRYSEIESKSLGHSQTWKPRIYARFKIKRSQFQYLKLKFLSDPSNQQMRIDKPPESRSNSRCHETPNAKLGEQKEEIFNRKIRNKQGNSRNWLTKTKNFLWIRFQEPINHNLIEKCQAERLWKGENRFFFFSRIFRTPNKKRRKQKNTKTLKNWTNTR